jgi:hypothetical protein
MLSTMEPGNLGPDGKWRLSLWGKNLSDHATS